jgi:6-phosphogluconolactonase (cycloisomerase 2 family)
MSNNTVKRLRRRAVLGIAACLALSAFERPARADGAVYTMTNAAAGNAIVMYSRSADGTLSDPESFPTGGTGNGAGLGSQGALVLAGGHWLVAANAGSNDVTVFEAGRSGLTVTDRQASGGVMPISIAVSRNVVFVLNAGGTANITGFRLTPRGRLVPINGSTRVLPGAAPAQVSFAEQGQILVVTEKDSNTITLYKFEEDGMLEGPFTHDSAGQTPFGFEVSKSDLLIVSEAAGGAPGGSTISSYELDDDGTLRTITAALPTGQTAACWVAVTHNGKYAYVANTGSSNISSLAVGRNGALRLLAAIAGETPPGTPAIDLAFSAGSRYLYALAGNTISVFRVSAKGALEHLQVVTGFPSSAAGLAAR